MLRGVFCPQNTSCGSGTRKLRRKSERSDGGQANIAHRHKQLGVVQRIHRSPIVGETSGLMFAVGSRITRALNAETRPTAEQVQQASRRASSTATRNPESRTMNNLQKQQKQSFSSIHRILAAGDSSTKVVVCGRLLYWIVL